MRLDELDVFKIEVSTATRQRHLNEVAAAVRHRPPRRSLRRLPLMLAAALLLIPLAALASELSVPGDFLHPIKRFLEPAWSLLDGDVRARHRVEELEALIEGQGSQSLIEQQVTEAEAAVGDHPLLLPRLEQAKEDLARGPISDEMRLTTTTTPPTTTTATPTTAQPPAVEPTTPATRPATTTTTVVTRGSTRP
jgi:hypothetical protein